MIKEILLAIDYEIVTKTESVIDPGKTTWEVTGFTCPSCKTKHDVALDHGVLVVCSNCHLELKRFGNSLECVRR